MNKDDIIRMAQEAGWSGLYMTFNEPTGASDWEMVRASLTVPATMEQIERFAALVAAEERETCAKIADAQLQNIAVLTSMPLKSSAAWSISNAIRARKFLPVRPL